MRKSEIINAMSESYNSEIKMFSIVIPMYNVAEYISDAFDSIVRQDIPREQCEVIAVDDHSDDNTREVVGQYEEKYPGLIRFMHNPGKGVSDARNYGMEQARGKYLLFLDADDILESDVLGAIWAAMEEGRLDMLVMTYSMLDSRGHKYKSKNILRIENNRRDIVSGRDFLIYRNYRGIVWMYAYRREFLVNSGVRMLPIRHEDENFIPRILARAERVTYAPIEHYLYRMREDSFMNFYKPENLFDILTAFANMRDDIVTTYHHDKKLCRVIEERAAGNTFAAVKRAVRDGFGNEMEVIEEARSKSLIPLRNTKGNLQRFLLNHFPHAFIAFYRHTAKKRPAVR